MDILEAHSGYILEMATKRGIQKMLHATTYRLVVVPIPHFEISSL